MNVVLYLRYSSDKQTEQSIEGQMRVCKAFCQREGYTIIGEYIDRATSASKNIEKRVNFLQMIKDSDKRTFQAVVVYKLDRFARDRYDSATYKYRLKKNGVRLISATENISENPEGIILESVLEGMAEFYSKELSQKIRRGMKETALKCNSTGGYLSLGYKIENHKFVINPATAPIVQEAFALYASGESVAEICRIFKAKGYKTKTGGDFNKNSFVSMFSNRKYIGEYRYADIVVPDGMPAIIDMETFEKVQERLKVNEAAPRRGKPITDYLLSRKMYCGHCGALMNGVASTSHTGRKYHYYACANQRQHKCNKRPIPKNEIERAVTADIIELLTPEVIEQIADMALHEAMLVNNENSLVPAIEQEIKDCDKAIRNLFKLVESGVQSDSLSARLKELEDKKKTAIHRLEAEKAGEIHLDKNIIIYFLNKFVAGDPNDPNVQRRVIDMLVRKVVVWDDPDGGQRFTYLCNLSDKSSGEIPLYTENTGAYNISSTPSDFSETGQNTPKMCIFSKEKAANPAILQGATNSHMVDLTRANTHPNVYLSYGVFIFGKLHEEL